MSKKWSAHIESKALLKACIRHDRRAEEAFYKLYFEDAFRSCNRYLSQQSDAMSVVNEGFLKVFQNLQKYDEKQGNIRAWIHRIMVNTAIDHLRREKRSWQVRGEELTERDAINHGINEAFYEMEADEVLLMVKGLPNVTRTVLII